MNSDRVKPAFLAAARILRCSSFVIRGLSVSERRSLAGFGGLPIRFIMELLYPQK